MISVDFDSTRVVVDMDALSSNMDAIREKAGVPVMAVVKADGIRFYDAFGKPVEREVLTADWDEEAAEKEGDASTVLNN